MRLAILYLIQLGIVDMIYRSFINLENCKTRCLNEVVEIDEEGKLGHLQQKRAMVDMKIAKERVKMAKKAKKSGEDVVTEKMDMKKADMGDVVKDFYKSDAPQFKGKSKTKRREMAIAAKLQADEDEN